MFADMLCILFVMLLLLNDSLGLVSCVHPNRCRSPAESSASSGARPPGVSGFNCVNVYKYIFCMYAFPNDLEKIDVIFIYCSGVFVSILYF